LSYGKSVKLTIDFSEAVPKVKEAFAAQGFGTLTEIDVQATLQAKIDARIEPYVILGACNPQLAHRALEVTRDIGLLLLLSSADRRQQLHRLIAGLLGHGEEVLGRWADVMVNSGAYAEIVDRHVELYSRLYWWGSVLDESEPPEEHLSRPRLSRISPATQAVGPVEDEWLRDNLVAIAQLAESLDRSSFELAFRIVPLDWWTAQLPDRPSVAKNLRA
jgi:hypothetical protein